jgi:hypothetical protein
MLPMTTTRVLVERVPADIDPYERASSWQEVGRVDGVVSIAAGSDVRVGGDQSTLNAQLHINPDVELRHSDRITDLTTNEVWYVTWVRKRYELGLEYTKAGLTQTLGGADG